MKNVSIFFSLLLAGLVLFLGVSLRAGASANAQEDILNHGRYISSIAGCTSCHTPLRAEFNDPSKLTNEQIHILAFNELQALDTERLLAGGRVFNLGPAGVVFTANITPDGETGIGGWTDEQVKVSIRTGQRPSGEMLFPVMPYHNFNGFADADLNAVVAYIRSVKAVNNRVPASTVAKDGLKPLPYQKGISAPSATDKRARGEYLVRVVMGCTDCHTPLDPATGAPQMDKYLAGQQPYEGPWGIVYGGNITPDKETGIGDWTETEIRRSIVSGIGKDGRRLILMPWHAYYVLTNEDADAVAFYIKNVLAPVKNEVPAPSLNPDFIVMATEEQPATNATPLMLIFAVGGLAALVVGIFVFLRKKV